MNNYKYKLQYTNDDTSLTLEFPADIELYRLANYLRDFLCGCSWREESVKQILRLEYDYEEFDDEEIIDDEIHKGKDWEE